MAEKMAKNKVAALALLLLPLLLMNVQPAKAWGPNTHVCMTKVALQRANQESLIMQLVNSEMDAFMCGLAFPDISVLYYYTKFEDYRATHNWLFYSRLKEEATTNRERVFAYGVAVHLIQDSTAHNSYVPMKVRQTLGSNFYTHPMVEGAVEKLYFDMTTSGVLENADEFLPLANKVLGRDVSGITHTFRDILRAGAFYSDAYKPPDIPFWNLYEWGASVAHGLYGVGDNSEYIEKAIQLTVKFLNSGELPVTDPTGIDQLKAATSSSNTIRFAITFVLALIVLFLTTRTERVRALLRKLQR